MKTTRVNNSARTAYEKAFNDKIDHFKNHSKYEWLREYSDKALIFHTGFGLETIRAIDFMDRIVAMPLDYIQDWLDGKNELMWTEKYKKALEAERGGYTHLQQQYPDMEIKKISVISIDLYTKEFDFTLLEQTDNYAYVGKKGA